MSQILPTYLVDKTGVPIDGTNPLPTSGSGGGAVDQGASNADAAKGWSTRITDGSAFITPAKTGQFPTALGATTAAVSLGVGIALDQLATLATQTTASAMLAQLDAKTSTLLTDAQLRATPVPVSGTTTANQGTGAGAAAPWSVELSDGAAFYTGAKTGQFPTTLGQTTKAGSLSVTLPSDIAGTTPTTSTKTASSAVALFASNTSAKKRVISNLPSSNGVLYVLYGSGTPTNDGANCSFPIQPGQAWEEQVIDGALCYNGAIQGILATGSTVQVCEIQ